MKHLYLLIFALLTSLVAHADTYTKREVRGVWLATVYSIDWPNTTGFSYSVRNSQKKEMTGYLDILQKNNFNAVYFQVRPMADALYASSYEPWSSYVSGTRGRTPGYDPLEFVVEECHKRGMECHAWINPYRWATTAEGWSTTQDKQVKNKNMLLSYTNGNGATTIIFNPALQETNQRICDVCREIIQKYDVDGIIFDDYFYPSGIPTTKDAGDYNDWKQSGTKLSFGDWRRANVNNMVEQVYNTIQEEDPSVKFGISPAGAACSDPNVAASHGVSPIPKGSDWQYNGIFSDPVAWLEAGTVDYISPQIYWKTNHSTNPFGPMTEWWSQIAKKFGRHHYASHSLTFLQSSNTESDWVEVGKQLQFSRSYTKNKASGAIYYSACDIDGKKVSGLGEWLKSHKYQKPALTPAIDWKETESYDPVPNLRWEENTLLWDSVGRVRYSVYAIPNTISDATANRSTYGGLLSTYLLGFCYQNTFQIPDQYLDGYRFAVCVYDRYGNEFLPSYVSEEGTGLIDIASSSLDVRMEGWELQLSSPASVQLYSTSGQLMLSQTECTSVSLTGMPSGMYIVKAANGKTHVTQKIFIR